MTLESLFKSCDAIKAISEDTSESWSSLSFSGTLKDENDKPLFNNLNALISDEKINKVINFKIDTETYGGVSDFLGDLMQGSNWSVNINKSINLGKTLLNFFYDKKKFKEWSDGLGSFNSDNPLFVYSGLNIVVNKLSSPLVGANFTITDENDLSVFQISECGLPQYDVIRQEVHILAQNNFVISPQTYMLLSGHCVDDTSAFFKLCTDNLVATLCSEVIDGENLVLRGIRKIQLKLSANTTALNIGFINELADTVKWIYEERSELRLKLFLDRITLDIDYNNDYVHELFLINKISLIQAKERYNFAIFDRKDQFQKELRDLLKDLKTISDLYSTKVRAVISNLLRDVLAGFLLIGITLLSKIENVQAVIDSKTIKYVFQAFAIYFLTSIVYQTVFDLFDLSKTNKEFKYWRQTSREYISDEIFKQHLKETVEGRKIFTYICYFVLFLTYLVVAYCCWNFTDVLNKLV